jgi:tRNA A37 methylthiotransferase MiaB
VVLTGVNTGDYGKDLDPPASLDGLLDRLLPLAGSGRLRLNSLEPRTISAPAPASMQKTRLDRCQQAPPMSTASKPNAQIRPRRSSW